MTGDYSPEFELASNYAESAASLPSRLRRSAKRDEPDEAAKHLKKFSGGQFEQSLRSFIDAQRDQLDSGYLIECAGNVYSNAHAASVALARRILLIVWNAASPDEACGAFSNPAQIFDTSLVSASWPSVRRAILDFPTVHCGLLSASIKEERNELLRRRMGMDQSVFERLIQTRQRSKLPQVDVKQSTVQFAGKKHEVTSDAAMLIAELTKSYPQPFPASSISKKPSRVRDSLPTELKSLIVTSPGKGYRLELPVE